MKTPSPSFVCASCARSLRQQLPKQTTFARAFASETTTPRTRGLPSAADLPPHRDNDQPRWKSTPPAMKMPVRLRPEPSQPVWVINRDEEKVNAVFDAFLGPLAGKQKGRELLDEETKWLTLTHKSFEHGRQGFNARLSFLGRRILTLQTSLALLRAPSPPNLSSLPANEVFYHPSLTGLENISPVTKDQVLDKKRLANIARQYGMEKVVRWKPARSDKLVESGQEAVLAQAVYAVVGAVALRLGGDVAGRVARERVLEPLGLK
ncbi:unnamed protein product [Zymoseptoria tritici ST99CH_1A5]|uniref:RNase III domain-containing protein n=2 Tax=Zymoseptoria tritici TaxID=1047171 RepID=A0A1X7S200_ZYMT9|nr:unnamed protein product [Zymoseptoria tritici ST99CH_3D7]SMY27348.1 unnamed protein product [Zymoseptoria tritici ST99CH_1A5]